MPEPRSTTMAPAAKRKPLTLTLAMAARVPDANPVRLPLKAPMATEVST